MAEVAVNIPRVSVAVSEATLLELLVPDGGRVEEGEPLFLLETEKVESEIPAGASGTVRWTGEPGTTYATGTRIGTITPD